MESDGYCCAASKAASTCVDGAPDPVPTGLELARAPAEYNDPFDHRRLRGEIGCQPPTAVENEFPEPQHPSHHVERISLTEPRQHPGLTVPSQERLDPGEDQSRQSEATRCYSGSGARE
jgi:hypothetical protein